MIDAEAFRHRLGTLERLKPVVRVALLNELLSACGPEEAGPVSLGLLDLAIVPADERPRAGVPRLIRLMAYARRRGRAGIHAGALRSLVRLWVKVPQDLRRVVLVAGRGRLGAAGAELARSADACDRSGVCELALEAGELSLAPVLAGLFEDQEASVAASAERALVRLAFLGSGLDPETGESAAVPARDDGEPAADEIDSLRRSIAAVVGSAARERRRGVLVGAMALIGPADVAAARAGRGNVLAAMLLSEDAALRTALRNALRWSDGPLARRRALEWLSIEALGASALERLARARSIVEHECVLSRAHLLANPARARRAAMLGRAAGGTESGGSGPAFVPAPEDVASLSRTARRGLARFVRTTAAVPGVVRHVIEPLTADADAVARHSCTGVAPPTLLADLTLDPDERVARTAMLAWSLVGERGGGAGPRPALRADAGRERLLTRLARSPHESIRALARHEISLLAWLDPRSPQGRASARRRLMAEPETLLADLRAVLLAGEPDDRIAAIQTVRTLCLHAGVERELLGLCEAAADGPRARVAATALAALAELGTDAAARAVTHHVGVADARVRANAVEGVGVLLRTGRDGDSMRSCLVELRDDPQHRARANALRALLARPGSQVEARGGVRVYEPAAVGSLLAMLADERPEHRLAGAWVAGRVLPFEGAARLGPRWAEVSVRMHELAAGDGDRRVRVRASQCAGLMRAKLRAQVTGAAGAPA